MTFYLLSAALLIFALGAAHSWLGERRLIGPLLAPERRTGLLERSAFARQVLRFAWHLTTLAWWAFAALLWVMARLPSDQQGWAALALVSATFFVSGIVTLVVSHGRHLAWPVFFAIALLCTLPLF